MIHTGFLGFLTCLFVNEVIRRCCKLVQNVHQFEKEEHKKPFTLAVWESFFIFDGKYYAQIYGAALRSSLGPTLVNAFFRYFQKKWFLQCPAELLLDVYKRYVDEIFVTFDLHPQL